MKIRVLVENTACGSCSGEHGLALLAEYKGDDYLIDTGASGLFAQNAAVMGADLSKVKAAFLSHAHYDHSGGFGKFFAHNAAAKVYLQASAARKHFFKVCGVIRKNIGIPEGTLEAHPGRFTYVNGECSLGNGIFILPHSTPELILQRAKHTHMCAEVNGRIDWDDFSHEQTVIFEEEDGLVCLNSCSHAGVDVIVDEVLRAFPGKRIKAFFGGFHMMGLRGPDTCSYTQKEVHAVAERLMQSSDAVFYSGHCTGTIAFDWLKEVMGDRLMAMSSGLTFDVSKQPPRR